MLDPCQSHSMIYRSVGPLQEETVGPPPWPSG